MSSELSTALHNSASDGDTSDKPTIVLVHGAFADSSSWAAVIERLRDEGLPVRAVANPLQGLTNDTNYLAAVLKTIDGPVVLVGHSYGGALISNLDAAAFDIRALVYVAAVVPALGEAIGELLAQSSPPLPLITADVPGGAEISIDPAEFHCAFAGDLESQVAAYLAIVQRPANTRAVSEATTHETYRTVPSWMIVTRQDRAISLSLQMAMAHNAGGTVVEVDASHAVMISRPDVVVDVIEQAVRQVETGVQV